MKKLLMSSLALGVGAQAEVAVTIYNENLAVIRDSVPIELKAGDTKVTYDRATAQVIPDSVVLRDPAGVAEFSLREQSYRNDPVSQGLLLSLFEGQEISFQKVFADGKVREIPGKVIRSGYQPGGRKSSSPVIETRKGLQFSLPGEPLFPSLGDDSILRPTLSWILGAQEESFFEGQLSYLSRGLTWEASYNLVAPEEGELVALSGWITANNRSGTAFEDAKLKLVAGDVNVVQDVYAGRTMRGKVMAAESFALDEAVQQKAFDDFHLYTLPRPITLRDQETKQVEFLRSAQVQASKTYLYDPVPFRYQGGKNTLRADQQFSKDVGIYWNFSNTEENGLGVAMPGGKVRFYREDSEDGNLEFVGENRIDHTARNEDLKIYTGNAFDLVGERKVRDFEFNDPEGWVRESIEITLKNRSQKPQTITAREHLWRWSNWQIESETDFEKRDSKTVEFTKTLKPDEVVMFSYRVIYSWD